jgi:hypothetical protein
VSEEQRHVQEQYAPTGFWQHLYALPSGPRFLLGPVLSARHQLLTDAQLICLLC